MNEALLRRTLVRSDTDFSRRKNYYKIGILIIAAFFSLTSFASDSLLVHQLVKRIAEQQISNDVFFLNGIFPSYISNKPIILAVFRNGTNKYLLMLIAYA